MLKRSSRLALLGWLAHAGLLLVVAPLGSCFEVAGQESYLGPEMSDRENGPAIFRTNNDGSFFARTRVQPYSVELTFFTGRLVRITAGLEDRTCDAQYPDQAVGLAVGKVRGTGDSGDSTEALHTLTRSDTYHGLWWLGRGEVLRLGLDSLGDVTCDQARIVVERFDSTTLFFYLLLSLIWWSGAVFLLKRRGVGFMLSYSLLLLSWFLAERFAGDRLTWPAAMCYMELVAFATVLEIFVSDRTSSVRRAPWLVLIYRALWLTPPLCALAYGIGFEARVDDTAILALLQTNPGEAWSFLGLAKRPWALTLPIVAAVGLGALFRLSPPRARMSARARTRHLVGWATLAVATGLAMQTLQHETLVKTVADAVGNYSQQMALFRWVQAERTHPMLRADRRDDRKGEIHLVVIGESQVRDHMSVYGYPIATTPWLEQVSREDGWIFLENAYSSHTHTVQVLTHALTGANQYNGRDHWSAPTLVDLARETGLESHWLSNQVFYGAWDNPVGALAKTADSSFTLNPHIGRSNKSTVHDDVLVDRAIDLLSRLDKNKSHLVVLHLAGSHFNYCDRVPAEFEGPEPPSPFRLGTSFRPLNAQRISCYDRSIAFNDRLLSRLFAYVERNDRVATLSYFADHGEEVVDGLCHGPSEFRMSMARIPVFFWLSPDYRLRFADRYRNLAAHADEPFTNDLMFDTLSGLFGIETDVAESRYDLTSGSYGLSWTTATTMSGEISLAGETSQHDLVVAALAAPLGFRILPHRVDTLGKLADVCRAGFKGFEVDLMYRDGPQPRFETGHDTSSASGGSFAEMLEEAKRRCDVRSVWLDLKNLERGNYPDALRRLELLDQRYSLRDLAIVESPTVEDWFAEFRARGWHTSYYLPHNTIQELESAGANEALESLARSISAQMRKQHVSACSFDVRDFDFVTQHLEKLLENDVVYHAWDLQKPLWTQGTVEAVTSAPYARSRRLRTLLLPFLSPYGI